MRTSDPPVRRYEPVKLLLDRALALCGLAALSPVLLLIGLLIYFDDPGPVIFTQRRAGRWHVPFTIYKFRTMKLNTPNVSTEQLRTMKLSPYTRVGLTLRKTSLDELPQLWNVLRGEMSLVGPRPALPTQSVVLRGRELTGVHQLRPGVTGLAQVTGRDDLPDDLKVMQDTKYLESFSLLTDLRILLMTLRAVLAARGAH